MSLRDLALLYLIAGLACAVAVYRSSADSRPRAAVAAAITVPLWPLWAPIALTSSRRAHSVGVATAATPATAAAASRVHAALREGVEACSGTSLESLLPREAAARIDAEVARAASRHAELTTLLCRDGFDLDTARARVEDLERSGASLRSLATARLHLDNVRRLCVMRDRDAYALDELADLVQAMRTQLVLARFAGSSVEGVGGIVSEVWARVEGLGAALDSGLPGRESLIDAQESTAAPEAGET